MNRIFVSFSGKCKFNCKHCFATEQVCGCCEDSVEEVLGSIHKSEDKFDIIYVSHYKENFINEIRGIELCEKLYDRYNKDLCITSRCVLSDSGIYRIEMLDKKMRERGHRIYWCESVPALESAYITEDATMVPSPQERILFLGKLRQRNIYSIITVRPLFPSEVVNSEEIDQLLEQAADCVDAVITGGLILTDEIEKRLKIDTSNWKYYDNNKSSYLIGALSNQARYVNVDKELIRMRDKCQKLGIAFFAHSTDAIEYLKKIDNNSYISNAVPDQYDAAMRRA